MVTDTAVCNFAEDTMISVADCQLDNVIFKVFLK